MRVDVDDATLVDEALAPVRAAGAFARAVLREATYSLSPRPIDPGLRGFEFEESHRDKPRESDGRGSRLIRVRDRY